MSLVSGYLAKGSPNKKGVEEHFSTEVGHILASGGEEPSWLVIINCQFSSTKQEGERVLISEILVL